MVLMTLTVIADDIIITTSKPDPNTKTYILKVKNGVPTITPAKIVQLDGTTITPDPVKPDPLVTGSITQRVVALTAAVNDPDKELNSAGLYTLYRLASVQIRAKTLTIANGLKELKSSTHALLVKQKVVTNWAAWRRGATKALADHDISKSSSPEDVASALEEVANGLKTAAKTSANAKNKKIGWVFIIKIMLPIIRQIMKGGKIDFETIFDIISGFAD